MLCPWRVSEHSFPPALETLWSFLRAEMEDFMRCPSCGGDSCHIIEESETKQKGFDLCSGLCGYVILGPIGILCGMCGMGEGHTSKRAYWICTQCGRKFRV